MLSTMRPILIVDLIKVIVVLIKVEKDVAIFSISIASGARGTISKGNFFENYSRLYFIFNQIAYFRQWLYVVVVAVARVLDD